MFFLKKKTVVLDCFTHNHNAFNLFKIYQSNQVKPDWWKSTDNSFKDSNNFFDVPTIKRCRGIIEYLNNGLIMPMWSDFALKMDAPNYNWQFADNRSQASVHNTKQWESYADPNDYAILKLTSPWAFKTKENVKFLMEQPYWHKAITKNDIIVPAGITDFKYQHTTNVFLGFNAESKIHNINAGDPLMKIIPLTDKTIELRHHLVDLTEFDNMTNSIVKFVNSYNFVKNIKNKKCPFSK